MSGAGLRRDDGIAVAVFNSSQVSSLTRAACVKCHRARGEGGQVGPELTGVGAKDNRAQLIKQIADRCHQTIYRWSGKGI